jgi:hypothetical protein
VRDVDAGDFEYIWRENLGVDLVSSPPIAYDLCHCPTDDQIERRRKRFKMK